MEKIVNMLINYGMGFEYEHNGSMGETINSFELDVRISSQQGRLYFTHMGEVEEMVDDERSIDYIVLRIEDIAIEETT